ncbi:zinc ABC transporter substrate-binding protein AdcA [Streptococcaceae bacterium ESL0687]|nr:zinc ABC transporter substrate-binding protein AdcA [Streptococcaceae bacterium ESL0687]
MKKEEKAGISKVRYKAILWGSILLTCTLQVLAACSQPKASGDKDKLVITASFYPVYAFTKEIVGDAGEVKLLVPAGSEPHDYEPSARDLADISKSDAFIYHNDNMETWVKKAQDNWKKSDLKLINATKDILLLPDDGSSHDHDHSGSDHKHEYDPHTWTSPYMAIKEVENIEQQLVTLYPDQADKFKENASKYLKKLKALDSEFTEKLGQAQQKNFVTQHSAFRYLALDYGLNQIPISGLNPDKEPSAARLAELKKYVSENDIKYIYFEDNTSDKFAKTLAKEAKVQVASLNPLESLTDKDLKEGKDYISVMKENLASLMKTTSLKGTDIKAENSSETTKTVADGYFSDGDVKDRSLSDYKGDWQSVYPLLQARDLDQVFDYKAKIKKDMTAQAYKEYYQKGYASDVNQIKITDDSMTFLQNGVSSSYKYKYVGYKILTYKKGNKGVRYLFETDDPNAGQFKYVQFSDHNIGPVKSSHFHIFYGGESQDKLLEEMDNWPTYYPQDMSSFEIAEEMLAH